jgi:hypothetical protein
MIGFTSIKTFDPQALRNLGYKTTMKQIISILQQHESQAAAVTMTAYTS